MKNLILVLIVLISTLGCKKESKESTQLTPTPLYFQLFQSEGNSSIPLSTDNLKIWYLNSNNDKIYIHSQSFKMKSGDFENAVMSADIPFLSAFKKINTFFIQIDNQKIDTFYYELDDLGDHDKDTESFPVKSVKFNGKPIQVDLKYTPGLWILK